MLHRSLHQPEPKSLRTSWFSVTGDRINASSHQGGYEPESINLAAIVALMIIVAGTIFYLGESFTIPAHTTGFFGPAAPL